MHTKVFIVGVMALALTGCGVAKPAATTSSTPTQQTGNSSAPVTSTAKITIENFAFTPAALTVNKGTSITVENKDTLSHSLTAADGSFDTGLLAPGATKTVTFNTVGSFTYRCTIHPTMTGTITVIE